MPYQDVIALYKRDFPNGAPGLRTAPAAQVVHNGTVGGRAVEDDVTESFVQHIPWEIDCSRYAEVVEAVQRGDLIPIETTFLTNRGGFWDAVKHGIDAVSSGDLFEAMLDVRSARVSGVTPLPLAVVHETNERSR